jgi:hypothetical protein
MGAQSGAGCDGLDGEGIHGYKVRQGFRLLFNFEKASLSSDRQILTNPDSSSNLCKGTGGLFPRNALPDFSPADPPADPPPDLFTYEILDPKH